MAKMKRRKSAPDFKKTKIKAGRRLPKHLNETKPEFTAKKILVRPFSSSASADLLRLLSSASINTSLKLKYLEKLNKDLGGAAGAGADLSLAASQGGEQIQVVGRFLTDVDHRVREAAASCLKTCLNAITGSVSSGRRVGESSAARRESLSPLLSILLTFVNCGLTHIREAIRDDACKFFAYLLDRCDASLLEEHLMAMFLGKIGTSFGRSLEAEYYRLLERFISKRVDAARRKRRKNLDEREEANRTASATAHGNTFIHRGCDLARRFSGFQDLQLTFQSSSSSSKSLSNTGETFSEVVGRMVVKDVKALLGKGPNVRMLNPVDGQKAVSALKIVLIGGGGDDNGRGGGGDHSSHLQELLQFWRRPGHSLPTVKIVANANSAAKGSSASAAKAKQAAHLQNELNSQLSRARKALLSSPSC